MIIYCNGLEIMCKKLLILVILKPHKYQLLTLFLFCDFRLSAEEKFASSHHFCSFFECLVIFFVSFCLFKRSYKDLVKFSHHFTSGKKSPPPPLSKIFPQRLSVTCSYVLMMIVQATTSLLLICESEIQSIDTFL